MGKKPKKSKIRAEFRKKHESRVRNRGYTRDYVEDAGPQDHVKQERISGKGKLTRKRTIIGAESDDAEGTFSVKLEVDESLCRRGRVLAVHGLESIVEDEETGEQHKCAVRRLLKSLSTDQRHVVSAGDEVLFSTPAGQEGFIERIEPRSSVLSRTSKGRQHVIVVNIDQVLIVASAAEPSLKPNLIDRFLVTAEKERIRPIICINKIDLAEPADLMPLIGVYGQMGYEVMPISATTGFGIEEVKRRLAGKRSVVAGQSGVGKSSLLNAVHPQWDLKVREVSSENQKGRHTTTTARLIPLPGGGHVVDTPGIRQFQLWDVIPEEVAGYYRDLRPFVNLCRFPDCTHQHEDDCAVKDAVADGKLDARRYESYCHVYSGDG